MTTDQLSAFFNGTGGHFSAPQSLLAVQTIGVTAVFLWSSWIVISAYKEWGSEEMKQGDMIGIWFRAVLWLMVLIYLLTI